MTVNNSFIDVAKFEHLGVTITNQKYIHKEIKSRLPFSLELLSPHLLSKNIKIKIITIILPILYGYET
jgi:hypothetical protein